MSTTPGRNDPCPCGSGRKYKHCHLRQDTQTVELPDDGSDAVGRVMAWLSERRRKAYQGQLSALFDEIVLADTTRAPRELDDEFLSQLQINLSEWLLADGSIPVKGEPVRTIDDVLGPDGPALSPAQRQRLEQLRAQPLRLYSVTDVRPGVGMTLVDAIDTAAGPVVVDEDLGSRTMQPGTLIGARLMHVPGRCELSGAIYGFALLNASQVIESVRVAESGDDDPARRRVLGGREIMRRWVRQFTEPRRLPKMVDAVSGEPLLLITDHYRVADAAALAAALGRCPDVAGDAQQGWRRESTGSDGLVRAGVVVNPGRKPERIEVFYRTQKQADEGRGWFDGVAGASVVFLTREITDPQGALSRATPGEERAPAPALSGADVSQVVEEVLRKHYASWCDEPVPALGGQTPRQAITTTAGLERVKGLLRSYEAGEREQSAEQGRSEVSFQFLWDGLGISR